MTPFQLHHQFFETTRGRIVNHLRQGEATVDEIADGIGVTANAVRVQLAAMERDGMIRRAAMRRGATRPSTVFELTPDVEQMLSHAYVPLLRQLLRTLTNQMSPRKLAAVLRNTGRDLAVDLSIAARADSFADRVTAASQFLNEGFGAVTEVEKTNGHFTIRARGCPLSAVTANHPGVCGTVESFLTVMLDARVRQCCDRSSGPPNCCFEVQPRPPRARSRHRTKRR